jgi:hypothetical protein
MTVVRIRLGWPVRILLVAVSLLGGCTGVGLDVQPEATPPTVSVHDGRSDTPSFPLPASRSLVGAQTPVIEQPESVVVQVRSAPLFTLPSATGDEVSLESFRGVRPVVLLFYRAFW